MANDDFARGFIPVNTGGKNEVPAHLYLASTVTDIAIGMLVSLTDGRVSRSGVTGMTPVLGVAGGFQQARSGSINELHPWLRVADLSSDDWYVLVYDDPNQEFFIQEDTGGTALTGTAGSYSIDGLYQTTSIDTTSGVARLEVDASSAVATTGALVQLLRLHDNINSDGTVNAVGDYAKWIVRILHHQRRGGTTAIR